eukprot:5292681-Pleurochrysis_carterae.AAC.1
MRQPPTVSRACAGAEAGRALGSGAIQAVAAMRAHGDAETGKRIADRSASTHTAQSEIGMWELLNIIVARKQQKLHVGHQQTQTFTAIFASEGCIKSHPRDPIRFVPRSAAISYVSQGAGCHGYAIVRRSTASRRLCNS